MNLYAICPSFAPPTDAEVSFMLAKSDAEAMEHAVAVAAHDAIKGYDSPSAEVFLIARDVERVGEAWATDAPQEWKWAHPGVEENAARIAAWEAFHAAGDVE